MKVLILAENLEINRTSSGITSNNQIFLYKKYFKFINVITSTLSHLHPKIPGVNYFYIKEGVKKKNGWIDKIPKFVALQNFIFGVNYTHYDKILLWKNTIEKILSKKDFDLIVSLGSGASFIPAYALYFLKKKYNFKHLMFIHDPYPLNQYPPPYQKPNSLPYQSVAKRFGKVLKSADILSFPSLRLMEWMSKFYPSIPHNYIIQPHIGLSRHEIKDYLPQTQNSEIPVFPEGLNIVHTGSLLGQRDPSFLIKALKRLFKNKPGSKQIVNLHIIGKINKIWDLTELNSDNVFVYPKRFSYWESLQIQQKAEILLIIEAVSEVSPFMPGKLADYLMAKKPILALTPKKSETTRILKKNYKLLAKNGNYEEIYDKLELLYEAYLNNSLSDLIPSKRILDYVSSEKWIEQIKRIKQDKLSSQ